MHRLKLCANLTLLAFLAIGESQAAAEDPPRLRIERAKPWEPKGDCAGIPYDGTVTEVTKNSITILWPGEKKPKRFAASETLAAGKVAKVRREMPGVRSHHSVQWAFMYRLSDVKVGDGVSINYAFIGGESICDHICIQRRPGGRVPPIPDGAEPLTTPAGKPRILYHEYMNAYWDLEDKGIPYPEKFGEYRRFPIAPMPRKLTLDGPVISN
jgi:hypothetical protein